MLGDIFKCNSLNEVKTKSEKFDIVKLYEQFVQIKCKIAYEEKNGFSIRKKPHLFKQYCEKRIVEHAAAAIMLLLNFAMIRTLSYKSLRDDYEKFAKRVTDGEENNGIIDRILHNLPNFVHRTFAEYFVAKWLSLYYKENRTFIMKHLYSKEFSVIRNFFDRLLCCDSDLHAAVLTATPARVRELLNSGIEVDTKDEGGRTALHLSMAVSYRDPRSKINVEIVNELIDRNANLDIQDKICKWRPLQFANQVEAYEVIETVLNLEEGIKNSDVKETVKYIEDHKKVELIIKLGYMSILRYLFEHSSTAVKLPNLVHVAAENGQLEIVKLFIERGVDTSTLNAMRQTPLHVSVHFGHTDVVVSLINNISTDRTQVVSYVNRRDWKGRSAMHLGAESGRLDLLKLLVEAGGDMTERDSSDTTTLMYAAVGGHLDTVKFIINHFEDIGISCVGFTNIQDGKGDSAVIKASREGYPEVVEYLAHKGADLTLTENKNKSNALHEAVTCAGNSDSNKYNRHLSVARALLSVRESLVLLLQAQNWSGHTALDIAQRGNMTDFVEILSHATNNVGLDLILMSQFPMHSAAFFKKFHELRKLVEAGNDVTVRDTNGSTTLMYAALNGHLDTVKFIIEQLKDGDDEGKRCVDFINLQDSVWGDSVIIKASKGGYPEMVEYLAHNGADLTLTNHHKSTTLNEAIEWAGDRGSDKYNRHLAVVRILLSVTESRASLLQARNNCDHTALNVALERNMTDFVELLLGAANDEGLNLYLISDISLQKAAKKGEVNVLRWLVEAGGDVTIRGDHSTTILMYAAERGHLDTVKFIIEYLDGIGIPCVDFINMQDKWGDSAVIKASRAGYPKVIEYLAYKGADLTFAHKQNTTILMYAVSGGHLETVKFIVEHFEDRDISCVDFINLQDINGDTAVIKASRGGYSEVVKYLAQKGADLSLTNKYLSNALHEAIGYAGVRGSDQYNCRLTVARVLLGVGESRASLLQARDTRGLTALDITRRENMTEFVDLLSDPVNNIGLVLHSSSSTTMHTAAILGDLDELSWLVKAGGDVTYRDKENTTTLICAAYNGHLDIVQFVIECCEDRGIPCVDFINVQDKWDNSAVIKASQSGHHEVVKYLAHKGADLTLTNWYKSTALHEAIDCAGYRGSEVYNRHLAVARVLLSVTESSVALLQTRNWRGHTALALAQRKNMTEFVELMTDVATDLDVDLKSLGNQFSSSESESE